MVVITVNLHCALIRSIHGSYIMESVPTDLVKRLLAAGNTYSEISSYLKQQYPHVSRGFSERSVRRYVKENDLKEAVKSDTLEAVRESAGKVNNMLTACVYFHITVCSLNVTPRL